MFQVGEKIEKNHHLNFQNLNLVASFSIYQTKLLESVSACKELFSICKYVLVCKNQHIYSSNCFI